MAQRAYQQPLHTLPQQQNPVAPQRKQVKQKFPTKFEKLLTVTFIVVFIALAVMAVTRQVTIYDMTREIKGVELETKAVQQENRELKATLTELSQPERIWKKAEGLGLTQSEQNVKVVPSK
ncbi:Cell division protein FtsL [Metalysinibacillus saudimassiliensis]|uniref:Cell division protein FtsL n=1 Tax=Metalysinibacillus saudimassiliensis TaxID=1461583 RepID=A0A078M8G7_9BACL|nr:Cell division protein FtsL [Metalysinibacillus saudimassiliensis]